LLTGKTGQLGAELNRLLPSLWAVIAPERNKLDLSEPEEIRQIMRSIKPQLIVNAAAYTAVDAAETDEADALAVNAEAPRSLAEEAKRLGALLVHFSTDSRTKFPPDNLAPRHRTRRIENCPRSKRRTNLCSRFSQRDDKNFVWNDCWR